VTYRVRTFNAISPQGLRRFPPDRYEVGPDVPSPHAGLLRSANLHGRDIHQGLLAVARAGAGTNNIPVEEYSARGIPVFNTPGANANAVKELVLAAIFLAARNIIDAASFAHRLDGDAEAMSKAVEAGKKRFVGFELPGRTLGVVGLGAVGVEVANSACGLGMRVLGYDPAVTVENAWKLSPLVERVAGLEQLMRQADIVTVHVPLLPATENLIGAPELASLRPSAVLVNFARGPIVAEEAVVAALDADRLRGYVCDFPSPALNKRPRVVTLPHLGASTAEAEENCAVMAVDQLRAFLENGAIRNSVNFPSVELPRAAGSQRLAVANANAPGLVGQISTILAGAGLNIADLINRSKGDLAYTVVDTDTAMPDDVVAAIAGTAGVLSARVINPLK
jgi:D-3-phosphoglycerate dehydrogenase